MGHQEMQKEEREEIIRDKADRKRKKTLAKDLKPSTPSHGVRIKKNTVTIRAASPRMRTMSPPSSSPRAQSPVSMGRRRSRTFTEGFGNENDDVIREASSREFLIPPSTAPGFSKMSVPADECPPGTA